MSDPIVNDQINNQKQVGTTGIFGGEEAVFDNEELFRPIDGQIKKNENKEELVFDIDKVDIENNENENFPIINLTDESEKINEEQVNDEEKFDPIFSDEEKIKDIPVVEKYSISEDVEEKIPVVEFKQDSPAEQANEITNVVKTEKIEKESEEEKSDLMKKFLELVNKTKILYEITQMGDDECAELVGGNTGKSQVIYNLWLIKEDEENNSILIAKVETDSESEEQQQNNLQFKNNNGSLEILLDEQVLYDEIEDLEKDQNKKMQVIDKLNKFIFLVSEELKVYERDKKEKERMEQERRKLRDIFRNF